MNIVYHHRTRAADAQGVHIIEIVKAFRALGHSVDVVSLVRTEDSPRRETAEQKAHMPAWQRLVRRIPLAYEAVQMAYNGVGLWILGRRLRRGGVDFLYERYSLFNFTGVLAAKLWRIPLVLEVNSPLALELAEERAIRARRLAERMERAICNAATKVIVVTQPLKRILVSNGVEGSKIVVMPNGVDPRRFQPDEDSGGLRRQLGLEGRAVIGFVGWFRKWHGLDLLLEAFREGRLAETGARLLLIGDGPAMVELQEFVGRHGMEGTVVFTGPLPHRDIPRHLSAIDIAVQPAANSYCCPMKILEYMALGKAIVAPRQENIVEILRDGEEAALFTPGDQASLAQALRLLVSNAQEREKLGNQARAAIQSRGYLWEANAARVAAMMQEWQGHARGT